MINIYCMSQHVRRPWGCINCARTSRSESFLKVINSKYSKPLIYHLAATIRLFHSFFKFELYRKFRARIKQTAISFRISGFYMLMYKLTDYGDPMKARTTDAQRENSLHCTAENSLPLPNFKVRRNHILSATLAQIFKSL